MSRIFSGDETALFFRLLLSHLFTDFLLQPTAWVVHKQQHRHRSKYLYWHGFIAGALAYVFAGGLFQDHWSTIWIFFFVGLTHGWIDYLKVRHDQRAQTRTARQSLPTPSRLPSFLVDQAAHIGILLMTWLWLTGTWAGSRRLVELAITDPRVVAILSGYLLCTTPIGFVVGMATSKWQDQLTTAANSPLDTLRDAGKWIGIAERVLIFSFVLLSQYEAIGFLIAAKSLLRFREDDKGAKQSEYVLVGTLLSYSLAILTGLLIKLTVE